MRSYLAMLVVAGLVVDLWFHGDTSVYAWLAYRFLDFAKFVESGLVLLV